MSSPSSGHVCGRRFFDNALADGVAWVDEDELGFDLTASEATWDMLANSGTTEDVSAWLVGLGEGEHQILQRFIRPFETHPSAEDLGSLARHCGRTSLNTVVCPTCGGGETRLRRWFMGSRTVWWCDHCVQPVPTMRLVG